MRIAVFTTAYLPFVGGAEIAIREISRRLPDIQFDIYTARLDFKLPVEEKSGNLMIYRLGHGRFYDKLWLAFWGHKLAARKHIRQPYDLIWGIMASFGGLAARNFKGRHRSIPFLLTLQEGDNVAEIKKKGRWLLGAFADIFRQADQIQAISNFLALFARSMGATRPITVIPNGVDLDLFKFRKMRPQNDPPLIITTSRLVPKNGLGDLVKALALIPGGIRLKILGDGPLKKSLSATATALGIADRVDFTGLVSYQDLPKQLAAADVFVRPSLSEGLGNAFLEAMAVGVPVVGTPIGGIPDFLKEGETGWLVKPGSPIEIAEKTAYILDPNNQPVVEAVSRQARALIEQKYDWDTIALRFRELFNTTAN